MTHFTYLCVSWSRQSEEIISSMVLSSDKAIYTLQWSAYLVITPLKIDLPTNITSEMKSQDDTWEQSTLGR